MTNSIKFDLHTHHERCGHAIGTIEDYVKQAIEYGLQYIGVLVISDIFIVKKTSYTQRLPWQKVNLSLILRKYFA